MAKTSSTGIMDSMEPAILSLNPVHGSFSCSTLEKKVQ